MEIKECTYCKDKVEKYNIGNINNTTVYVCDKRGCSLKFRIDLNGVSDYLSF